jgi:hypothetical protein
VRAAELKLQLAQVVARRHVVSLHRVGRVTLVVRAHEHVAHEDRDRGAR